MKKKIYAYNNIYFFMYMCLYICVYTRVCVCDSVEIKKKKKNFEGKLYSIQVTEGILKAPVQFRSGDQTSNMH